MAIIGFNEASETEINFALFGVQVFLSYALQLRWNIFFVFIVPREQKCTYPGIKNEPIKMITDNTIRQHSQVAVSINFTIFLV